MEENFSRGMITAERKAELLAKVKAFMSQQEVALFEKKMIGEPKKKKEKKAGTDMGTQTKLCMSREPFSNAIWRMDNPELAQKQEEEKMNLIVAQRVKAKLDAGEKKTKQPLP